MPLRAAFISIAGRAQNRSPMYDKIKIKNKNKIISLAGFKDDEGQVSEKPKKEEVPTSDLEDGEISESDEGEEPAPAKPAPPKPAPPPAESQAPPRPFRGPCLLYTSDAADD